MSYNAITIVETLVEDHGWDVVVDVLMELAVDAPDEDLAELEELFEAAMTVNEGRGQLLVF